MVASIPTTFDNVLARDRWLWDHLDVPLLTNADQDRLQQMPESARPAGAKWIEYARAVAQSLEAQDRWTEAQAYWFASIKLLMKHPPAILDDFIDATLSVVKGGVRAAGLPADQVNGDLEDIVVAGLENATTSIQEAVVRSLLLVGSVRESIYADADFTEHTRQLLGKVLQAVVTTQTNDRREPERVKGSHQQFLWGVRAASESVGEIVETINEIAATATLENLKKHRPRLLKQLNQLQPALFVYEQPLHYSVTTMLETKLINYIKTPEQDNEDAYEDLSRSIVSIIDEGQSVGSHFAACVLMPLTIVVDAATRMHFEPIIKEKYPILSVQPLKPLPVASNGVHSMRLVVTNSGKGTAQECDVQLYIESDTDALYLEPDSVFVGTLAPGQVLVFDIAVHGLETNSTPKLTCKLDWRERSGEKESEGSFAVERQDAIAWDQLSKQVSPYQIQSITQPERLKGRSEHLRSLHDGFLGRGSFMITGQKRVGKTSLAKVFLADLEGQPEILPMYIHIGDISAAYGGEDLGRLGRDLAERIVEEFEQRFGKDCSTPIPTVEEFRDSFNASFTKFVRRFVTTHQLQLVFTLDDFNELPAQLFTGAIGRAFFSALRAIMDRGTSFLFVGSERLPAIVQEQAERLNQVIPLVVDYLDRDAICRLVREPAQGLLHFTDGAIDEIETWSACNPYFATLICISIWDRARERRDRCVVGRDVQEVVQKLAYNSARTSFEHFWADSPLESELDRQMYSIRSAYLILSLSRTQSSPLEYAPRQKVLKNAEGLTTEEADVHMHDLISRNIVAEHPDVPDLIRLRVPLFALWLKHRGAVELRQSHVLSGRMGTAVTRRHELSTDEINEAVRGLSYRGYEIGTDQLRGWVEQFGNIEDQRLVLKLLHHLKKDGFYDQARYLTALGELHKLARQVAADKGFPQYLNEQDRIKNWFVTHADATGKSGGAVVKSYRSQNLIYSQQCGSPHDVIPKIQFSRQPWDKAVLICVDDFIGTGNSAIDGLKKNVIPTLDQHIPDWQSKLLLVYSAILGYEEGVDRLRSQFSKQVAVICGKLLTPADKAFSHENDVFENADQRQRARDLAHKIGSVLEPRHPLGYEGSEALVVFYDNVPNNTLPIFHKFGKFYNEQPWTPIFPRS